MRYFPLLVLASCSFLPPDNPAEEAVEEVIHKYSGLDIDLTSEDEKASQKIKLMEF